MLCCLIHILTFLLASFVVMFARSPNCLIRYAALDAYACLLLHTRITELSDPIFGKEDDLCVGDKVLMYTRGGNDRVAEGCIVEYGQRWGTTGVFLEPRQTTRGHARRWAVRLEKVLVARAKALYPNESDPRGATTAQIGKLANNIVLWDASRLRKIFATTAAATEVDHTGGSALPAEGGGASVTSASGGVSSADGNGSKGADAPTSTGVTGPREGGAGGRQTFVTPSEPFFAGQLSGIEALSSESVAYSTSVEKGSDVGGGGEGGGTDGQETVVDVTGDVSEAKHEEFAFLKVSVRRDRKGHAKRKPDLQNKCWCETLVQSLHSKDDEVDKSALVFFSLVSMLTLLS